MVGNIARQYAEKLALDRNLLIPYSILDKFVEGNGSNLTSGYEQRQLPLVDRDRRISQGEYYAYSDDVIGCACRVIAQPR